MFVLARLVGLREFVLDSCVAVSLTNCTTALTSLSRLRFLGCSPVNAGAAAMLAAMPASLLLHIRVVSWVPLLPLRQLQELHFMHVEGLLASRAEDTKSSWAQYSLSTEDSDLKECLAASSLAASAGLCVRPHGGVMSGTRFDRLAQLPAPPCGCRFENYSWFATVRRLAQHGCSAN